MAFFKKKEEGPHIRSILEDANRLAMEICEEICPDTVFRNKYKVELILRQYLMELDETRNNR